MVPLKIGRLFRGQNMKNGLKVIILSLAMAITSYMTAVIPEMEVWADEDNEHFLYLLKDIHLDYKGAQNTIKQQQDILWALQQNQNSFLLVEDSATLFRKFMIEYDLNTEGTTTRAFPRSLQEVINSWDWDKKKYGEAKPEDQQLYHASPLQFLAHFCQNAGTHTFNVECQTIIDLYKYDTYDNEQEHRQAQQKVHDVLHTYNNHLKSDTNLTPYCNLLDQKLEYLQRGVENSDYDTFQSVAMSIRSILLEARILYQLKKWKNMQHGYIVTGSEHIDCIKQNLPSLGYKHIKTIGISLATYITEVVDKEKNILKIKETIETPYDVLLSNALDLHRTFTEIFNEQKPLWQKVLTYLVGVWMKIR